VALAALAALLAAAPPTSRSPRRSSRSTPQIAGRVSGPADRRRQLSARGRRAPASSRRRDDGSVLALEADTGRELWRANVGAKLAAGVGSDGRVAAVVTRDGELVAVEAGRVLWRKPLALRVTTAPLVARRACVRARQRPQRACVRRAGRQQAVVGAAS
jgi:hypothetical protein